MREERAGREGGGFLKMSGRVEEGSAGVVGGGRVREREVAAALEIVTRCTHARLTSSFIGG